MIDISIHASQSGLEVAREYPENSGSITLRRTGTMEEITIYLPVGQWWLLRHAFPKAADYGYASEGGVGYQRSGIDADADAKAFYDRHLAKQAELLKQLA